MIRAAVLQNSIGIGGRSKVISEAITLLQESYDEIYVHTLSGKSDQEKFLKYYDIDRDSVKFIKHRGANIPGTIYQQIFLNLFARGALRKYDLVFNSNNAVSFLPPGPKYIHYIHFPGTAIPRVEPKYQKLPYKVASIPIRIISKIVDVNSNSLSLEDGIIFTNSTFTANYAAKSYNTSEITILPPPSLETILFNGFSGSGVVSLGSFHPNKRQLFQLQVAKSFPDISFEIIGSKESEKYYKKCEGYRSQNNLNNVNFHPNAPNKTVEMLLDKNQVFLHSMKNEKFGMATVEALNRGCVPVVHDSGGQKEVVPDSSFRFNDKEECIEIISGVIEGKRPEIPDIDEHLKQYTKQNFKEVLEQYLHVG